MAGAMYILAVRTPRTLRVKAHARSRPYESCCPTVLMTVVEALLLLVLSLHVLPVLEGDSGITATNLDDDSPELVSIGDGVVSGALQAHAWRWMSLAVDGACSLKLMSGRRSTPVVPASILVAAGGGAAS